MLFQTNGQYIPCPVCKTGVPFDAHQLLRGVRYSCPQCHASMGLAVDSMDLVRTTLATLERKRAELGAKAPGNG